MTPSDAFLSGVPVLGTLLVIWETLAQIRSSKRLAELHAEVVRRAASPDVTDEQRRELAKLAGLLEVTGVKDRLALRRVVARGYRIYNMRSMAGRFSSIGASLSGQPHRKTEWRTDLAGLGFWKTLHRGSGLIIAALKIRLRRSVGRKLFACLDWLLTTNKRSTTVCTILWCAAAAAIQRHDGWYGLISGAEALTAIGGFLAVAVPFLRRWRGIQAAKSKAPV